eukprot:9981500-Alexandrium_andersonii.AAC.1
MVARGDRFFAQDSGGSAMAALLTFKAGARGLSPRAQRWLKTARARGDGRPCGLHRASDGWAT